MRRLESVCHPAAKCAALAVAVLCWVNLLPAGETVLDRYVAKPDATYSWKVVRKTQGGGATQFVVDLKSQTWRMPKRSTGPSGSTG